VNEQLVAEALARVLEQEASFAVRPDTPLSSFGPIDQVWVMLARAIFEAAQGRGLEVKITDADIREVQTFGELVQLVDTLSGAEVRTTS
jgi:ABC-type lipopolysaccharide export system ATPase subunit